MEEELVVLAEHSYERALVLKSRLEGEGIDVVLSNVNLLQPDASAGVRVKVRKSDLERAMKVYVDFLAEVGEDPAGEEERRAKNKGIRKILVPVDLSEPSRHAALFAMLFASHVGAEVLLLHAYYAPDMQTLPYDETFGFQGTLTEYLTDLRETARRETQAFLKELKKEAAKEGAGKVKSDYFIVKGSLDDAVFYAGESYGPDLIVLGARGRDRRRNDPIGSMAARIIEKADVPVWVVPEEATFRQFLEEKEILYATNYDEADFVAVRRLMQWIEPFGKEILCVHFTRQREDEEEKVKMEGLLRYFREACPALRIRCRIIEGEDVVAGLDDFVTSHPVAAIAMTTHRRSLIEKLFFPSIAKKMFFHTRLPLLVFHS